MCSRHTSRALLSGDCTRDAIPFGQRHRDRSGRSPGNTRSPIQLTAFPERSRHGSPWPSLRQKAECRGVPGEVCLPARTTPAWMTATASPGLQPVGYGSVRATAGVRMSRVRGAGGTHGGTCLPRTQDPPANSKSSRSAMSCGVAPSRDAASVPRFSSADSAAKHRLRSAACPDSVVRRALTDTSPSSRQA